jgi:hypothetical protein
MTNFGTEDDTHCFKKENVIGIIRQMDVIV